MKSNYWTSTIFCITVSGGFVVVSIILFVASLGWQGLVEYIPKYAKEPDNIECVYEVPRREGFFKVCHTMTPINSDVNNINNPCVPFDYGVEEAGADEDDAAYFELLDWHQIAVVLVIIGLILAIVGLILLLFFSRTWLCTYDRSDFRHLGRVLVGLILLSSGLLAQFGLLALHVTYLREKQLKTNKMKMIYSSWIEYLPEGFELYYSHSYFMLIAAIVFVELAGIIIFIAGHFSYMLRDTFNMDETMQRTSQYDPSLPRYSVGMPEYDELVKDVDKPGDELGPAGYYELE